MAIIKEQDVTPSNVVGAIKGGWVNPRPITEADRAYQRAVDELCSKKRYPAVAPTSCTAKKGHLTTRVESAMRANAFKADVIATACHVMDANPWGVVFRGEDTSDGGWVAFLHPSNLRQSEAVKEHRGYGVDITLFFRRPTASPLIYGAKRLFVGPETTTWCVPMWRLATHEMNHCLRRPVLDVLILHELIKCNALAPTIMSLPRAEAFAETAMGLHRDVQHVMDSAMIIVRGAGGASGAFADALGLANRIGHAPEYGKVMVAAADIAAMRTDPLTATVVECVMSITTASGPGVENHKRNLVRDTADALMKEQAGAALYEATSA